MAEIVDRFVTWKIVTSAVCVILFSLLGAAWSTNNERLRIIDQKLEQKVDINRYNMDLMRIEKKLDLIITMHMQRSMK